MEEMLANKNNSALEGLDMDIFTSLVGFVENKSGEISQHSDDDDDD